MSDLDGVKKFRVLPIEAGSNPGGMETIALYGPDGEPLISGGGNDLSAVDQNIVVINSHSLDLQGDVESDSNEHITLSWGAHYGLEVRGDPGYTDTDTFIEAPNTQNYVGLFASDSGFVEVRLHQDDGQQVNLRVGPASDDLGSITLLIDQDVRLDNGYGVVLQSPGGGFHRLIVADDGSLSTTPVTY